MPEHLDREIEQEGLSLSVGQRKKLMILKLLIRAKEASVIILDEIEAGLDQNARRVLERYLNEFRQTGGKIILMIEHDAAEALQFDQTFRFSGGGISCFGCK